MGTRILYATYGKSRLRHHCYAARHARALLNQTMNSPLEPASPASSSSDSLEDDVTMSQEYTASSPHEKSDRSAGFLANSFAFAKSVAKRRLPGGTTRTTSNRDSKARRREEGSHRKGGTSDRRDPTKGKDDLLDVALFETLKKSTAVSSNCPLP